MKKLGLVVILSTILSSIASADIYDRISACEAKGGGACLYDLLRELATAGGGGVKKTATVTFSYTNPIVITVLAPNGVETKEKVSMSSGLFNNHPEIPFNKDIKIDEMRTFAVCSDIPKEYVLYRFALTLEGIKALDPIQYQENQGQCFTEKNKLNAWLKN